MTMDKLFDFKGNSTKAKVNRQKLISFFKNNPHDPFDREEIIDRVERTGVYYAGVSFHCDDLVKKNFLIRYKISRFVYQLNSNYKLSENKNKKQFK
jgi:hypothetical protein